MFDDAIVAICLFIPQVNACVYLAPLRRYDASKITGPWPFGVRWRHRTRDHSTPAGRLHMGGP